MACIKKRGEANMERVAPEGSSKRAMALTGSVGSVVGGGVAGAVLAGPAAPIGFVVGAAVGGLVVAGVLASDGVLDEQAIDADNEQPTNAKLEDALLGKFRGGNGSGPDGGSRPDGGNRSSGGTGSNADLFSRLGGKGPNPWLPANPAKSGGNGPNGGNGSGDGRGGGTDGGSKVGEAGGEVVGEGGGGNGGAAGMSPLDRLSTMWSEWTTKNDHVPGYGEEGWREEQAWKTK